MNSVIALGLVPGSSRRQNMVVKFWLEASPLNKSPTVREVFLIGMVLFGKDRLNVMISLVVRACNPDTFGLVYGWYYHVFSSILLMLTVLSSWTNETLSSRETAFRRESTFLVSSFSSWDTSSISSFCSKWKQNWPVLFWHCLSCVFYSAMVGKSGISVSA